MVNYKVYHKCNILTYKKTKIFLLLRETLLEILRAFNQEAYHRENVNPNLFKKSI